MKNIRIFGFWLTVKNYQDPAGIVKNLTKRYLTGFCADSAGNRDSVGPHFSRKFSKLGSRT